jgi:hypothetical protein
MYKVLFVIPLLALVACATPQQSCIASATRELNNVNSLIQTTQANIARGYALYPQQQVVVVRDICTRQNPDGTSFNYRCDQTQTVTNNVPVAIDVRAEREKLQQLQQQQARLTRESNAAVQQCVAAYPE